jgi:hypothetical protein
MWAACLGRWHHKARDFSRGLFTSWATGEGYQLMVDIEAEHGQRVVARIMSD